MPTGEETGSLLGIALHLIPNLLSRCQDPFRGSERTLDTYSMKELELSSLNDHLYKNPSLMGLKPFISSLPIGELKSLGWVCKPLSQHPIWVMKRQ